MKPILKKLSVLDELADMTVLATAAICMGNLYWQSLASFER